MNKIPAGYKKTEVGIIPEDWVIKSLGDVLKIKHGKSQKDVSDKNGSYPILASGGVIGMANKFIYNKPSVLIGRKGTIDAPQYMETPFWSVDTLFYSEIFDGNYPRFLFYKFLLVDWYAHNEASGVPSLNAKTIEQISVSMPPTRSEQIAIATALNDADALITQLEKLIAKKRLIKQGAMQQLLTGKKRLAGFDRHPDGRPKGHKQTALGPIPEDWNIYKLSELVNMKSGVSITSKHISLDGKYPCYGGNGLRGYTDQFTHSGRFALIGRQGALCGNVQFVSGDFFASEHAIVATPKANTEIKLLYYVLIELNLNQYSESSAQPGLSVAKILDLPLPYPVNLAEQTAIATIITDMETEIEVLETKLAKHKQIKQGMMQTLLTGKIRLL